MFQQIKKKIKMAWSLLEVIVGSHILINFKKLKWNYSISVFYAFILNFYSSSGILPINPERFSQDSKSVPLDLYLVIEMSLCHFSKASRIAGGCMWPVLKYNLTQQLLLISWWNTDFYSYKSNVFHAVT